MNYKGSINIVGNIATSVSALCVIQCSLIYCCYNGALKNHLKNKANLKCSVNGILKWKYRKACRSQAQMAFVFTLCCTGLILCGLWNVTSFFCLFWFSPRISPAGYHGDKVRFCTVQQALFFSGFAQTRECLTADPHYHPLLSSSMHLLESNSNSLLFAYVFVLSYFFPFSYSLNVLFILICGWMWTFPF